MYSGVALLFHWVPLLWSFCVRRAILGEGLEDQNWSWRGDYMGSWSVWFACADGLVHSFHQQSHVMLEWTQAWPKGTWLYFWECELLLWNLSTFPFLGVTGNASCNNYMGCSALGLELLIFELEIGFVVWPKYIVQKSNFSKLLHFV